MTPATDAEIVAMMRAHFEGLFPKECPNCRRRFATLRDYILATRRIGPAISYDAELQDWKTSNPIGAAAHSNCPCGSTLTLTTEGMALEKIHRVLEWIRVETQRRSLTVEALIDSVRSQIRQQVLAESDSKNDSGETR
jgi:hypothetical protein